MQDALSGLGALLLENGWTSDEPQTKHTLFANVLLFDKEGGAPFETNLVWSGGSWRDIQGDVIAQAVIAYRINQTI